MDNSKINKYQSFFADQIKEAIAEQKKINHAQMRQLFKTDNLALAYVDSVDKETGMVILKCPRRMAPRLKVQRSLVVIKKGAKKELGDHPMEWTCKWEDFASNPSYHSPETDCTPMYFVTGQGGGYDYVACSGISTVLYDLFVKTTSEGKSLSVLMYSPFPPLDYFNNMAKYMDLYPENEELYLEPTINYEDWTPDELAFDETYPTSISDTILQTLEQEDACIVQGPPGTGKSYTIATIIANYLARGKKVCVTTMANKGLIELIKQKPIAKYAKEGRISKTNLSVDERKQTCGVKHASSDLNIAEGELLCATNYVLSSVYSDKKMSLYGLPSYDLIIIEEASQAFLTSIAAFKQLGDKCMIVGDPMQLPPIVKLDNSLYNTWNVNTQVEGLKTYALGTNIKAYRIVTTFRLTQRSAALTKVFYNNRFVSVKQNYLDYSLTKSNLFPSDGGVIYCCTGDVRNGAYSQKADAIISSVIDTLNQNYPERSLAIITPFRDSVKELQKRFARPEICLDITIETIDRIQGMTVDYTILYLPARNATFALEERRFNVATSRSLSTTLIISDPPTKDFHSVAPTVTRFIDSCDVIDVFGQMRQKSILETSAKEESKDTVTPIETPLVNLKVVGKIDLSKFERPKKELKADKKNYYIIDTNVFINYPDIVSRIEKKYPIILSAKVADELDKMKIKLDEVGKRNAEKALRMLNKETEHKIIYEFADVSLLPDDFDKRTPDNMILSVALKYKDENPIMLTSDNGLQLKSKVFGISTISLKSFLKR